MRPIARCGPTAPSRRSSRGSRARSPCSATRCYERGTADEFRRCYLPVFGRFLPRTRAALGNHEYGTGNADAAISTFRLPRRGWYSYRLGAWHVVVLNSNCSPAGGCGAGSPQELWLATRPGCTTRPSARSPTGTTRAGVRACTVPTRRWPRSGTTSSAPAPTWSSRARPPLRALRADRRHPLVRRRHRREEPLPRPDPPVLGSAVSSNDQDVRESSASRCARRTTRRTVRAGRRLDVHGHWRRALPLGRGGTGTGSGRNASLTRRSTLARRPSTTGWRPPSSSRAARRAPAAARCGSRSRRGSRAGRPCGGRGSARTPTRPRGSGRRTPRARCAPLSRASPIAARKSDCIDPRRSPARRGRRR